MKLEYKIALVAVAAVAWWILGPTAPPTGYIGRANGNDVYCGYKPTGNPGGPEYTCEP